jgi:tetratricopeptide (TPR) repeat protein
MAATSCTPGGGLVIVIVQLLAGAVAAAATAAAVVDKSAAVRYGGKRDYHIRVGVDVDRSQLLTLRPNDVIASAAAEFAARYGLGNAAKVHLFQHILDQLEPRRAQIRRATLDGLWHVANHRSSTQSQVAALLGGFEDLEDDPFAGPLVLAEAQVGAAVALRAADRVREARDAARNALSFVYDYAPAANQLGICQYHLGHYLESVSAFRLALSTARGKGVAGIAENLGKALIWNPFTKYSDLVRFYAAQLDLNNSMLVAHPHNFDTLITLSSLDLSGSVCISTDKVSPCTSIDSFAMSQLQRALVRNDLWGGFDDDGDEHALEQILHRLRARHFHRQMLQQAQVGLSQRARVEKIESRVVRLWKRHRVQRYCGPTTPSADASLHLVVQIWGAPTNRWRELMYCLQKNIMNGLVVHVLADRHVVQRVPVALASKLEFWHLRERANASTLFDMSRNVLPPDSQFIVANADIWFDAATVHTLKKSGRPYPGQAYALLRYDVRKLLLDADPAHLKKKVVQTATADSGLTTRWTQRIRTDMQDCWILRTPPAISKVNPSMNNADQSLTTMTRRQRFEALVQTTQFFLGRIGADNQLVTSLKRSGFRLANPSLLLSVYHEHGSEVRTYSVKDRVAHGFDKYKDEEEERVVEQMGTDTAMLLTDSLC